MHGMKIMSSQFLLFSYLLFYASEDGEERRRGRIVSERRSSFIAMSLHLTFKPNYAALWHSLRILPLPT
jgi:hypothetical protein